MIPFLAHSAVMDGFTATGLYPFDCVRTPVGLNLHLDVFLIEHSLMADFVAGLRNQWELWVNGRPLPTAPTLQQVVRNDPLVTGDSLDVYAPGFGFERDEQLGLVIPQGSLIQLRVNAVTFNDFNFKALLMGRLH